MHYWQSKQYTSYDHTSMEALLQWLCIHTTQIFTFLFPLMLWLVSQPLSQMTVLSITKMNVSAKKSLIAKPRSIWVAGLYSTNNKTSEYEVLVRGDEWRSVQFEICCRITFHLFHLCWGGVCHQWQLTSCIWWSHFSHEQWIWSLDWFLLFRFPLFTGSFSYL